MDRLGTQEISQTARLFKVAPEREYTDLPSIISQYRTPLPLDAVPRDRWQLEKGGFTPQVAELAAMDMDFNVVVYEFLQNMSYGLGHEPPPIVMFELKNGSRVAFTGKGEDFPPKDEIKNCQFITTNPEGINVSEAVIYEREADKSGFGHYARGLKQAATFLLLHHESDGLSIEINSVFTHGKTRKRHSWAGKYALEDTTSGKSKQLNIYWAEPAQTFDQTIFSVNNPPDKFLDALKNSPSYFLPMNRRYRGGLYVPSENNARQGFLTSTVIEGMLMDVVDDKIFDDRVDFPTRYFFVDGNRTINPTSKCMFVYHFAGGLDPGVPRWARIIRDSDSLNVKGVENIRLLIREGLNTGELGVNYWESLFEKISEHGFVEKLGGPGDIPSRNFPEVPIELESVSSESFTKLTPIGKKTLQTALNNFLKKHPNIKAISRDAYLSSERYERKRLKIPHKYEVLVCHGLSELIDQLDDKPPYVDELHKKHVEEAIITRGPVEKIESVPIMAVKYRDGVASLHKTQSNGIYDEPEERLATDSDSLLPDLTMPESPAGLTLESAGKILGTKKGIKFRIDEEGRAILLLTKDIPVTYHQGRFTDIFDQRDNETAQSLNSIIMHTLHTNGQVNGTFIEAGTDIATFRLKEVQIAGRITILADGEVRDTYKTHDENVLEMTFEIPEDETQVKIWQEAVDTFSQSQIETDRNDREKSEIERAQKVASDAERETQRLKNELAMLNQTLEAKVDDAVREEKKNIADKLAEIEKMRQEIIESKKRQTDMRRQTMLDSAVLGGEVTVAATGALGAGFAIKEWIIPAIQNSSAFKDGIVVAGDQIHAVAAGTPLMTLLGNLEIVQNEQNGKTVPRWSLNSDTIYISAGDLKTISRQRLELLASQKDENGKPKSRIVEETPGLSMVLVEGMTPKVNTGGFFRTSYSDTIDLVGNHFEGRMATRYTYRDVHIENGRPDKYILRQVYKAQMPKQTWKPLALRNGEKPIAFAGVENAQIRQNKVTGGWEVKLSETEGNLIIYTGVAGEEDLTYLQRQPTENDTKDMLDMESLRPDIKKAILDVKSSKLTDDQKIDELLGIWRRIYVYDMGTDITKDFPTNNSKVYTSAMINQGLGPCGYAAYGAAAILRAGGIPANVIGGFVNESYGSELTVDKLHGNILVWSRDRKSWRHIEPQVGRISQRYAKQQEQFKIDQVDVEIVEDTPDQREPDEVLDRVPVEGRLTDGNLNIALKVTPTTGDLDLSDPTFGAHSGLELDGVLANLQMQRQWEEVLPIAGAGVGGLAVSAFSRYLIDLALARKKTNSTPPVDSQNLSKSTPKYDPGTIADDISPRPPPVNPPESISKPAPESLNPE